MIWVHIGADPCGAQWVMCGYIEDGEAVGDDHRFALLLISWSMCFVIPRLKPTLQSREWVRIVREQCGQNLRRDPMRADERIKHFRRGEPRVSPHANRVFGKLHFGAPLHFAWIVSNRREVGSVAARSEPLPAALYRHSRQQRRTWMAGVVFDGEMDVHQQAGSELIRVADAEFNANLTPDKPASRQPREQLHHQRLALKTCDPDFNRTRRLIQRPSLEMQRVCEQA